MPARRGFTLPAVRRAKPRFLAASLVLHGILVVLLVRIYSGFTFKDEAAQPVMVVAMPRFGPGHGAPPAARPRPAPPVAGHPLVAPATVTPLSEVQPQPVPATPIGPDSGIGAGGAHDDHGLGMRPSRGDARLWVTAPYIPEGGGRPIDMDSITRRRMVVMANMMDSIARNGGDSLAPYRPQYQTPSWTFQRNGKTYGIDQTWIHLGSFKLPTALLAFLPMPQGNIDQAAANARLMDMRADILRAAARSEAEEDFKRAVAQIRARRDRERTEQRQREEWQRQNARDNDKPIP